MIIHKKYRKVNSYYLCDVLLSIFGDDSLSLYYEYIYIYIQSLSYFCIDMYAHTHDIWRILPVGSLLFF